MRRKPLRLPLRDSRRRKRRLRRLRRSDRHNWRDQREDHEPDCSTFAATRRLATAPLAQPTAYFGSLSGISLLVAPRPNELRQAEQDSGGDLQNNPSSGKKAELLWHDITQRDHAQSYCHQHGQHSYEQLHPRTLGSPPKRPQRVASRHRVQLARVLENGSPVAVYFTPNLRR